jgi:hypothetical protein
MGLSQAAPKAARLMDAGRAGSTPSLIVEHASLAEERRLVTTLSGLADEASGLSGPALLIVGEATALAEALPFPRSGRGGPSAEEPMVERAGLRLSGTTGRPISQQVEPSLSTPRSTLRSANGPPLPLRGKGRVQ